MIKYLQILSCLLFFVFFIWWNSRLGWRSVVAPSNGDLLHDRLEGGGEVDLWIVWSHQFCGNWTMAKRELWENMKLLFTG